MLVGIGFSQKLYNYWKKTYTFEQTQDIMNITDKSTYHHWISNIHPDSILPEEVCRDLNVDDLFEGLDYTTSCIGKQYLYHLLCMDKVSDVKSHEALIQTFTEKPEVRQKLIQTLKPLGNPDAYTIASLLAEDKHEYSSRYLMILQVCRWLPLLFTGLIFIFPSSPLPFLFLLVAYIGNGIIHFREKNKQLKYFFSIPQLSRLLQIAEKLTKENIFLEVDKGIIPTVSRLNRLKRKLKAFRFGLKLEGDGAALAYLFTEFLNIFFLTASLNIITSIIALSDKKEDIAHIFRFVGMLDVLCSVSVLREQLPYWCHPVFVSGKGLHTQDIYHPLIKGCVANDLSLSNKSALIIGSNMSGKTSFIRTIAINLMTAKALNTCFAHRYETDLSFRLYSVIHTEDDLLEGKSYFFKEAENVKNALQQGESGNCLLIFDELFKGTNTIERIAINAATFSKLADAGNIVLASTHDLELAEILKDKYDLYHFCETVTNDKLSFDYTLKPGVVKEGNAIRILELCGYPEDVVDAAKTIANKKE